MRYAPAAGSPRTRRGTSARARRSPLTAIGNKQRIRPVRGFKAIKTAYATIKRIEVMWSLRKGQARAFALWSGTRGISEVRSTSR